MCEDLGERKHLSNESAKTGVLRVGRGLLARSLHQLYKEAGQKNPQSISPDGLCMCERP